MNLPKKIILAMTFFLSPFARGLEDQSTGACRTIFDFSVVQRIIHQPQSIIAQEETFWRQEPVMGLYRAWALEAGVDSVEQKWHKKLADFARLSPEERENSPLSQLLRETIKRSETFQSYASSHVCPIFPFLHGKDLPIYFVAFMQSRSFVSDAIVIDVASDYWRGSADILYNNLVREMSYWALAQLRRQRQGDTHPYRALAQVLEELQVQGVATYLGYVALPWFPSPDEPDYTLLENSEVGHLLARLNLIFQRIGKMNDAKFLQLAQTTGKSHRAYAVVGAHMAKVIATTSGLQTLAEKIHQGPLAFVTAYNALVDESQQLHVPEEATILARQRSQLKLRFILDRAIIGIILVAALFMLRYFYKRKKIS